MTESMMNHDVDGMKEMLNVLKTDWNLKDQKKSRPFCMIKPATFSHFLNSVIRESRCDFCTTYALLS